MSPENNTTPMESLTPEECMSTIIGEIEALNTGYSKALQDARDELAAVRTRQAELEGELSAAITEAEFTKISEAIRKLNTKLSYSEQHLSKVERNRPDYTDALAKINAVMGAEIDATRAAAVVHLDACAEAVAKLQELGRLAGEAQAACGEYARWSSGNALMRDFFGDLDERMPEFTVAWRVSENLQGAKRAIDSQRYNAQLQEQTNAIARAKAEEKAAKVRAREVLDAKRARLYALQRAQRLGTITADETSELDSLATFFTEFDRRTAHEREEILKKMPTQGETLVWSDGSTLDGWGFHRADD